MTAVLAKVCVAATLERRVTFLPLHVQTPSIPDPSAAAAAVTAIVGNNKKDWLQRGGVVTRVLEAGAAQAANLKVGDVLLEVNGVALGGEEDMARLLSQKGGYLIVKVQREYPQAQDEQEAGVFPSTACLRVRHMVSIAGLWGASG